MPTDAETLHVSCPKCHAEYLLPAHLLGPGGARVRCPSCRDSFDVPPLTLAPSAAAPPSAEPALAAPPHDAAEFPLKLEMATTEAPPPASSPGHRETAQSILAELATREGEALERAARDGRLFAQFGPAIFAAWDEYRKREDGGGAASFREALRERWGVDLPEVTPR